MSWIARLDTRADRWRFPAWATYTITKWSLVGLGGFLLVRMWLDRTGVWPLY